MHGGVRDPKGGRGLGVRHPAEEVELHDLRLPLVPLGQPGQGLVEGDELLGSIGVGRELFRERDVIRVTSTLLSSSGAGMIDEDPTHGGGGQGEEVGPVREVHVGIYQPGVRLVDEGRGAEGVVRPLSAQATSRQIPELVVDQGDQLIQEPLVAGGAPGAEESGNLGGHVVVVGGR